MSPRENIRLMARASQLFQTMVMLHMKLNGIKGIKKNSNMVAHVLPTDPPPPHTHTPPDPVVGSIGQI